MLRAGGGAGSTTPFANSSRLLSSPHLFFLFFSFFLYRIFFLLFFFWLFFYYFNYLPAKWERFLWKCRAFGVGWEFFFFFKILESNSRFKFNPGLNNLFWNPDNKIFKKPWMVVCCRALIIIIAKKRDTQATVPQTLARSTRFHFPPFRFSLRRLISHIAQQKLSGKHGRVGDRAFDPTKCKKNTRAGAKMKLRIRIL